MLRKFCIFFAVSVALLSCEAKTTFLYPKFKEMTMEKSFDESTGQCKYFDKSYKNGQIMVTKVPDEGCQDKCICHVSAYFEGFLCEPLCPQYYDKPCSPGWESKTEMVPAGPPEFGCFCTETTCIPSLSIEAFRQL